mgnify:CR=1 FL=1
MRVRFAPSPTGMFHVGSARTSLYNWLVARHHGGTFVLRIEDTDEARNRPEWTQGILDAMTWLGMSPEDPMFEGPYYQSANVAAHTAAARRLYEAGDAYYCDLPPGDGNVEGDPIARSRTSRDKGLGPGPDRVLRFRVPAGTTVVRDLIRGEVEFDNSAIEDFVILRRDGSPLFLIANVADDMAQGITHVIRGEEHFPNTPKQQMMWSALGATPPTWAHVPVLVNEQRKKLSKRRDKVALEAYRAEGYVMPAMRNYLMTLGWSPGDDEIVPWSVVEDRFRLEDVIPSPAFFDLKKLAAFNGEYIRMMAPDEFLAACRPWIAEWSAAHPDATWSDEWFLAMAGFVQQRCTTLADAPGVVDFLMLPSPEIDEASWDKTMAGDGTAVLTESLAAFEGIDWTADAIKAAIEEVGAHHELKLGKAQAPVRVAVTGRTVGPPLFEALEVMGRGETIRRMRAAADRAASGG